jgi:hypothetical protein
MGRLSLVSVARGDFAVWDQTVTEAFDGEPGRCLGSLMRSHTGSWQVCRYTETDGRTVTKCERRGYRFDRALARLTKGA